MCGKLIIMCTSLGLYTMVHSTCLGECCERP